MIVEREAFSWLHRALCTDHAATLSFLTVPVSPLTKASVEALFTTGNLDPGTGAQSGAQ